MSMILNNTVARMAKQSAKGFSAVRYMSKETYTERQEKTGRPLSPHVQIYKFPPAALSSITNRVTGVLLYTGKRKLLFFSNKEHEFIFTVNLEKNIPFLIHAT